MFNAVNSIINYFRKPEIPENLRNLERNKYEFENYLRRLHDQYVSLKDHVKLPDCDIFCANNISTQMAIDMNSDLLFMFCYYSTSDNDTWYSIFTRFDNYLLNYKVGIDGYSPICALIMSDKTVINKRIYIQHIMEHNILPTEKDIGINNLILYNRISFDMREIMISLLCDNKILLIDARKFIVNMWIKCLRYEYCPLF